MTARRIDGGQPIRDAMKAGHVTLHALAARTKAVAAEQGLDSGRSMQLIASLATAREYARDTTTEGTGQLIEDSLGVPRGSLFEYGDQEGMC